MDEMFSNAEDCYLLSKKLINKLDDKINFNGSIYTEIPQGKYLSLYRRNKGENMLLGNCLHFYFKFSKNEFLRIGVCSNSSVSLGEKLAALSDFYEVLCEEYGEPTFFYTTKEDDEDSFNLQWSFVNKKNEISKLESGKYFDDADILNLIIFDEDKNNINQYNLSEKTKKIISRKVGLPFELIYLLDMDLENYIKYKVGREINIPIKSNQKKLKK